jgi:hypothetical protein
MPRVGRPSFDPADAPCICNVSAFAEPIAASSNATKEIVRNLAMILLQYVVT